MRALDLRACHRVTGVAELDAAVRAVELYPIPAKDKHQLLAEMSKGEFDMLCVMIKAVQARPPCCRML